MDVTMNAMEEFIQFASKDASFDYNLCYDPHYDSKQQ